MASNPRIGDTVLSLDANGLLTTCTVFAVNGAVVDAMRINSIGSPPQGFAYQDATGLTEVADVASPTSGTWCRREVCG